MKTQRLMRVLGGFLLATLLMGLPSGSGAEEPKEAVDLGPEVIWLDQERGQPLFIPQSVFDHTRMEDLPIPRYSSLGFRLMVRRHPEWYRSQFSGGVVPECWPAERSPRQGASPEAEPLESLLRDSSEVYVGIVSRVVDGWDFHRNQIGQLVAFEIEERLWAKDQSMDWELGEVFILLDGGRLVVDGTELCQRPIEGLLRPSVGDTVVLSGYRYPDNPLYFQGYFFPVEDGAVQPQPYPALQRDQAPVDFRKLSSSLVVTGPEQEDLP